MARVTTYTTTTSTTSTTTAPTRVVTVGSPRRVVMDDVAKVPSKSTPEGPAESRLSDPAKAAAGWLKFLGYGKVGMEDKVKKVGKSCAQLIKAVEGLSEKLLGKEGDVVRPDVEGAFRKIAIRFYPQLRNDLEKAYSGWSVSNSTTEARITPQKTYENFFGGLDEGWKLYLYHHRQTFSLMIPLPPFVLEDRGLKVDFEGFKMKIMGIPSRPLDYTIFPSRHPHVRGGRLCEGAGRPILHEAKRKWDICTMYLTVKSIMGTYYREELIVTWSAIPPSRDYVAVSLSVGSGFCGRI